ncbi:hypothetical protein J4471_01565 [Candidatus Woesearchaeota archaeon]|nr:hypothetical protein [Candidatus Woesearchaeota archaeon]
MINYNLIKSKKGIFSVIYVSLIALLITYTTYLFFFSEKSSSYIKVGETSSDVYRAYGISEKFLFFIDQSVKYASFDVIDNVRLDTDCGFKENHALLLLGEQTCFLDDKKLTSYLNNSFNTYISQYLGLYNDLDLKNIVFDTKFEGDYIIGRSDTIIDIKVNNVSQQIKPSFTVKMDFDLKKGILESTQEVKRLYTLCQGDKNCWEINKKVDTIVEYKGKFFIITIDKNIKYGLKNKKLKLDFGLDFETNPLFR